MRKLVISTMVLALAGDILAILIAPKMIHYWFEPPVAAGAQAAFNCTAALDWGIGRLISFQIWATIAGAVVGLIIGIVLWNKSRKAAAAAAATATAAATPAAPVTTTKA